MTEERNELLKEKLKLFFETRIEKLTNKLTSDINLIDELKYNIYDNIIIPYREIKEEEEKEKEKEKEKELEKEKEKEKKKETKKVEEPKEPKANFTKIQKKDNTNLTKTPMRSNRKRELDFKGKTEAQPKKSRVFSGKSNKNPELNQTFQKDRNNTKSNVTLTETNKKTLDRVRSSRTPLNKKERGKEKEKEEKKEEKKENKSKKYSGLSHTAYKPSATKKFTSQKRPNEKKGKHDKQENKKKEIKKQIKKVNIKSQENKEKTEDKEEKKVTIKFKGINPIPEELKNKNALYNIYLIIKGNYLSNKENYKLVLSHPLIYKSFGNDVKFLLKDTKKELQSKISELENFLNKYDDLPNIVSETFQPSKPAMKFIMFVKKEEIENLIKKGNIIKEFADIIKIILYLLEIEFDEKLTNDELLQFFNSEVLDKNQNQNLMKSVSEFLEKNKCLNITKEKVDKIEDIIKSDDVILSITEMTKRNRYMSYCTALIKEFYEFITKKTSDGIPHYELKNKAKILKEYKYKLATIENNGIPPKIEEENKSEEKIEEKKEIIENNEKKEDTNNEIKDNLEENREKDKEIEQNKVETQGEQNPPLENQKVEEQNVKNENNE